MKVLYHSEIFTEDFEINLAKKNGCKGIFKVEVHIHRLSTPLLLKDGLQERITPNTPFVLTSHHPITNGLLRFEFSEYPELQEIEKQPFKKAIVRYLYCE